MTNNDAMVNIYPSECPKPIISIRSRIFREMGQGRPKILLFLLLKTPAAVHRRTPKQFARQE